MAGRPTEGGRDGETEYFADRAACKTVRRGLERHPVERCVRGSPLHAQILVASAEGGPRALPC